MEKEYYYITAEQMKTVNQYVEIQAKAEWVQMVADDCLDKVNVTASQSGEEVTLPPMYMENAERKSRYLLGFFLRLYLNWQWEVGEGEDKWLLPYDEYDKWMRGHIFAQIEKFKSDKEIKDICFNLLAEYKDVERRLNNEIYGKLNVMNDPASRQIAAMQLNMTPGVMNDMIAELNEAKDALDEYQKTRQAQIDEAVAQYNAEQTAEGTVEQNG